MEPQLPQGEFSLLSTLSQTLAFHSSPESFISSRAKQVGSQSRDSGDNQRKTHQVIRARILNRNVAVVSSYRICKDILRAASGLSQDTVWAAQVGESIGKQTFAVQPAYRELMADFFPPPNLLLEDHPNHEAKREIWEAQLSSFPDETEHVIRSIVLKQMEPWLEGSKFDLYESMKTLAWKILLGIFLDIDPGDTLFEQIESLQEALLRGQFSLFPVAVNTPFWRSPRSKGLDARRKLQGLLNTHMRWQRSGCPFQKQGICSHDDLASNVLLFTSSIAVKALASLLTASLLNLYLMPGQTSLACQIRTESKANADALLQSVLMETERLCPPVVGVMRRIQQDIILTIGSDQPVLVPKGWDVWLYFASAARDSDTFGAAEKFIPERYISPEETSPGFAFGFGSKACLGQTIVRRVVLTVAKTIIGADVDLHGSVDAPGVRGWLGWEENVAIEQLTQDLKQLPCQRPKDPINVKISRGTPGAQVPLPLS